MDLPFGTVVNVIAGSTTGYMSTFAPVFLLIGGILLAFIAMAILISIITGTPINPFAENDDDDRV